MIDIKKELQELVDSYDKLTIYEIREVLRRLFNSSLRQAETPEVRSKRGKEATFILTPTS